MKSTTARAPGREIAEDGRSRRWVRPVGGLTGIILLVAAVLISGTIAGTLGRRSDAQREATSTTAVSYVRPHVSERGLERRSGVRLVQLAVTGEGGLLDLRFQVMDPNAAASIHDAETPPAILEESTGLVAAELLMGHSHTSPFNLGATYYLIFENPGNLIHRGDRVSVLLGDAQVQHVTVR